MKVSFKFLLLFLWLAWWLVGCKSNKLHPADYDPEGATDTRTKPVNYQVKRTWRLGQGAVNVSNEFEGARLNDFRQIKDSLYLATINPENAPINESPWYAFKIWAENIQTVAIEMEYGEGYRHRYYPDISYDLKTWTRLDSTRLIQDTVDQTTTLLLEVGPKPLYVAAQEIMTSAFAYKYAETLSKKPFISHEIIGYSSLGKPLPLLKIGNQNSKKIVVVLGRQHPPEATGFFALQKFMAALVSQDSLATRFRSQFLVMLVPMVNPDGIDQGHWRHNAGGVDLNRDWYNFYQPETAAIRDYFNDFIKDHRQILFQVDFHSTQEDLFYVFPPQKETNLTGFTHRWLNQIESKVPGYQAQRILSQGDSPVSTYWFFTRFKAEAVTYEVGDDSSRKRIQQIAESAAEAMMHLLLKENGKIKDDM
ncbi:MAG: M14 family metallopeptidase [Candidatus Cyclobacteriaceae bacterium M3_2C_046]